MAYDTESRILLSGDSRAAEAAVQDTINELEKLRREAEEPLGKIGAVEGLRSGMDSLSTGVIKSTAQLEKERVQLERLEAELREAGIDTRNLAAAKTALEQKSIGAAKNIANLKDKLAGMKEAARGAAQGTREAADAAERAGNTSAKAVEGFSALATRFVGVYTAIQAGRAFIEANQGMESLAKSLQAVTGSASAAKAELGFIESEANRLGIEVLAAANSYKILAAATKGTNLEGQATRDIWSAVASKMIELGASTADVEGAMTQLAQGASKGKFELEDLKSIAERIPGFFNLAAKSLGVTTAEFYAMVSAGQITADLLPQIAASLGGTKGEIDSFAAGMARMSNAWTSLMKAFGDLGVWSAISSTISGLASVVSYSAKGWQALADRIFGTRQAADEATEALEKTGTAGVKAGEQTAASFDNASQAVTGFKESLDKLSSDLNLLGIDKADIDTQIGVMEDRYVQAFRGIATSLTAGNQDIFQGLIAAVDKVQLRGNLEQLMEEYIGAFRAGKISADQFAVGLDAINTKQAGLWKALTDTALAEQKRLEAGLAASAKRREEIETEFAKRRGEINKPADDGVVDFNSLFQLQARARELSVRAGQATGAEAQRLSDEALATARQAADVVQKLNDAGQYSDLQASGALKEIEAIAVKGADALKNVPITIDQVQVQQQAQIARDAMQQVFASQPLVIKVQTQGGPAGVDGTLRDAALQIGR